MLDVVINKGRKSWGGYISGMDVIPIEAPPILEPPDEEYSGDDMDFDVVSGADKAVVMLWDSMDGMTPVCEACKTTLIEQ